MRKIVAFENVSLDGYFSRPNGEIDWFVSQPGNQAELDEFAIDSIKSTDLLFVEGNQRMRDKHSHSGDS